MSTIAWDRSRQLWYNICSPENKCIQCDCLVSASMLMLIFMFVWDTDEEKITERKNYVHAHASTDMQYIFIYIIYSDYVIKRSWRCPFPIPSLDIGSSRNNNQQRTNLPYSSCTVYQDRNDSIWICPDYTWYFIRTLNYIGVYFMETMRERELSRNVNRLMVSWSPSFFYLGRTLTATHNPISHVIFIHTVAIEFVDSILIRCHAECMCAGKALTSAANRSTLY